MMQVLPINEIVCGDSLEVLREFPSESVDCIITSPPYWGLRDYGVDGQLGLEPTLELYIEHMLEITAELQRVLKKTGVLFWNHGDSYATHSNKNGEGEIRSDSSMLKGTRLDNVQRRCCAKEVPRKCMVLQNYRLILKMVDEQGWILRNDIIWHKPNHMPSSVKDRFTSAHEPVFMLTKNQRYWFDLAAVRKPHQNVENCRLRVKRHDCTSDQYSKHSHGPDDYHPLGKNPGDVWRINTHPFPDAHFATFPEKLITPMIKAACPGEICKKCGNPRERILEVEYEKTFSETVKERDIGSWRNWQGERYKVINRQTVGWSDCGCGAGWESGVALDPFLGSGTVAKVALKLRRNFVGIDISKEYCEMALKRIKPHLDQTRLESFFSHARKQKGGLEEWC